MQNEEEGGRNFYQTKIVICGVKGSFILYSFPPFCLICCYLFV